MPNADNAREFVDQIADLWRKRRTFKGLFGLVIVTNSLLFTLIALVYFLLSKTDVITTAHHFVNFFVACGLFIGLGNLAILGTWAYWRTPPTARSDKILILFAPSADPEASDLVYKLFERFRADIYARQMESVIECCHLPEHIPVRNNQEAHVLLAKTGARLIVYGIITRGKLKGVDVEGFTSISFAVRHRSLGRQEQVPVMRDLTAALAFRTFCAKDTDSFIERHVVVHNLSEVSLFFVALALTLDARIDDAIKFLEPLLATVQSKANAKANNPQITAFLQAVKSCLSVALQASFTRIYDSQLVDHITERAYDDQARQCEVILGRLLKLSRSTASYFMGNAIIRFHFGDIAGAKAAIEHAKRLSSFDHAGPYLSMAFLNMWERQYRPAFMQYMRAGRCKNQGVETITSVLQFLNTMLRLHPDRHELRFAIAFVNDRFYDQQIALRDYRMFLLSKPDSNLDEFKLFATRQVNKIESAELI